MSAQRKERESFRVLGAQIFFFFFFFFFFFLSLSHLHLHSEQGNTLLVTLFIKSSFSIALTMMMEKKKIKEVSKKEKKSDDDDEYHRHHHRERIESWRRNLVFESFDDDFDVDDDDLKGEGEITKMITQRKRRAYAKLRGEFFSSSENNNNACDSSSSSSSSPKLSAMKRQNFSHMFQKKELVRVVTQDVRRIVFAEKKGFGGKKFWQSPDVRAALIRVLTVFVLEKEMESSRKSSGDVKIEYKQGMHEIVAMVYLATCRAAGGRRFDDDDGESEDDNNDEDDDDDDDDEENYDALLDASLVVARDDDDDDDFYSQKFVEHDCYALFSAFVNNTKSSLRLLDYFQSQNESFIDEYCLRFFNKMHAVDEETARIFFSKMSLTRLYLPRFLKLAYVRECKRGEFLLMIWDSIIAEMGREGRKHSSNYPSATKDREGSGEAVQHHHHQSSYGSAREFFESLSVAAVLRCCKDTITRDESLHQSNDESIGNIINKINAHSFEFSKPSDVDIFIQTAKRVAFEKKIDENEEEEEDEEEEERYLFDESVFKSNLFSAMEIRDDYVSSLLQ